jgi:hypothetical protein
MILTLLSPFAELQSKGQTNARAFLRRWNFGMVQPLLSLSRSKYAHRHLER